MISVSVKGVLVGVLLIALIVLVVFLIVMVSNVTDTIKKANAILDGSMAATESDEVSAAVHSTVDKVKETVSGIADTVKGFVGKLFK